ncbi:hypothetical protein DRN98_06125, partial [Methanosarcinales archaeon]
PKGASHLSERKDESAPEKIRHGSWKTKPGSGTPKAKCGDSKTVEAIFFLLTPKKEYYQSKHWTRFKRYYHAAS